MIEYDLRPHGAYAFSAQITVDDRPLGLHLRWHPRIRAWGCRAEPGIDQIVRPGGQVLVDPRDYPGRLVWVGPEDYGREDLGDTLRLIWVPSG